MKSEVHRQIFVGRLQMTDRREGKDRDRNKPNIVTNLVKIHEAKVMKDEKEGEGEIEEEENIDDILEKYKFLTDEKELLGTNKLSEREKMKPELDDELMDRVDAILERYKFLQG